MSTSSFSRHGAVDLSQLKQKAQQPPPPGAAPGGRPGGGAGAGAGGAGTGSYVVELTEQSFETVAIRGSMQHPVIVEFYSGTRATPGTRELSTALASLANSSDGKFLLGRLDIDTAQQIASAIGLQAVPTVVALIGGQLAPLFQGAVPADQLAQVVDSVLKAAVSNGIVGRAEPVGGAAEEGAEEESGPDPRFAEADAALERSDFAAAEAEFDKLLQANPADAEAKAGKAQAGLLARASKLDAQVVMLAASGPDAPVQAHLDAADLELATGRVEDAFTRLIGQVRARTGDERDQVRVRLLELFETVGNADPRVLKARRELMTALF